MRPDVRLHVVCIMVRDQDRSLRFYLGQLGFRLAVDYRLPSGDRWILIEPPDGSGLLALIKPSGDSEACGRIGGDTGVVLTTNDIRAVFEDWSKRNVRFPRPPEQPPWGGFTAIFEDIDGNRFSLVEVDAITQALAAERRAAAEKREAERRMAYELEIAKAVQARLLPQRLPPVHTLSYAGTCIQARAVGGDYYDFLDLGRGRLGLVEADVAGKGIAAALLMANLQANLRSQYAVALDDFERLLSSVNRLFFENTPEAGYATLFFAEYEDASQRLRYANCGHPAPLLVRQDGSMERLAATSTVIGLFPDWQFSMAEADLRTGDTLVMYTDGVTEALNDTGEEFGEQRLLDVVRSHARLPAPALLEAIADAVRRFGGPEQADDITLVVARCGHYPSG